MAVSRPLRQRTSHALITLLAASSYAPHGHGTFTFTLFHRNHVRANFATFCVCHGGVQEGVFQCRIMLFAAVAYTLLENSCTRGCNRSPTRSCPSRTPCRCAIALGLTVCPLPWLIGTPFTHRFARSPPLHPICRHVAEHPGALLTRFFRLSGADCCAAISPRGATLTPEQLKPQRRGREVL